MDDAANARELLDQARQLLEQPSVLDPVEQARARMEWCREWRLLDQHCRMNTKKPTNVKKRAPTLEDYG